jgi:hypothetical protein
VSRFRFASLSGTFTNVAYVPSDVKTFDKLFFNFFKLILGKALSLFWGRKPRIICKNFSKFLKFLFFGPKMGLFLALLPLLPLLGLLSPLFHWILRSIFNWGLIPPHATKAHRPSWLSYLYIYVVWGHRTAESLSYYAFKSPVAQVRSPVTSRMLVLLYVV